MLVRLKSGVKRKVGALLCPSKVNHPDTAPATVISPNPGLAFILYHCAHYVHGKVDEWVLRVRRPAACNDDRCCGGHHRQVRGCCPLLAGLHLLPALLESHATF